MGIEPGPLWCQLAPNPTLSAKCRVLPEDLELGVCFRASPLRNGRNDIHNLSQLEIVIISDLLVISKTLFLSSQHCW